MPKHSVFANRDGFWVDGVKLPDDEIITLAVKGFHGDKPGDDFTIVRMPGDDPADDGWLPTGCVELLDTSTQIVMRIHYNGPFLIELCPFLEVISITHRSSDSMEHAFQREIVTFSPRFFRVYKVKVDEKGKTLSRERLEV